MAGMPPGADTTLPVAASTRPRIARDSRRGLAQLVRNRCARRALAARLRVSAFQPGSPPSRCALSVEAPRTAARRRRATSASTHSSVAARRWRGASNAAASPRERGARLRRACSCDSTTQLVQAAARKPTRPRPSARPPSSNQAARPRRASDDPDRSAAAAVASRQRSLGSGDLRPCLRILAPLVVMPSRAGTAGLSSSVRRLNTGQLPVPRRNAPAR